MTTRVECWNCGWVGDEADTNPVRDLEERMLPGDTFPAGECPECGCLAIPREHKQKKKKKSKQLTPKFYFVAVVGCVDPTTIGPFASAAERDQAAKKQWIDNLDAESDLLLRAEVDAAGDLMITAFSNKELEEYR